MVSVNKFSFTTNLSPADWRTLLEVARHAIKYGLAYKSPPHLDLQKYSDNINAIAASFITLKESNVLRGCVGSVNAHLPLVQDVANHAFSAAFQDQRFNSINHIEEPVIHISISLVSQCETFSAHSECDLIDQIEALKCGVILHYKDRHATLLPDSWNTIKSGQAFLKQLKHKLNLSADYWSDDMIAEGYLVQTVD